VARQISFEEDRADVLAALGRVDEAFEVARGITDGYAADRARAFAKLAPQLAALHRERCLPLWQETLELSATRSRQELLADVAALAPVVVALGGPESVEETCRAIHDVGRWWP